MTHSSLISPPSTTTRIRRSIEEPVRAHLKWEDKWHGADYGLIASWEHGREKAAEDPALAAKARAGQLVILPWKGGVGKATKSKQKSGTLDYLAMWQGLRGEDLNIDLSREIAVTCTTTGVTVLFTGDPAKYADA